MVSLAILSPYGSHEKSRQALTEELSAPIGLKPVGDAQFLDQLNQWININQKNLRWQNN